LNSKYKIQNSTFAAPPRIHLVTYATPRFRLRQVLLGWSARLNHVADTVTSWTPEMLRNAGFEERCKDIKLSERGSGFWAWKPFVILKALESLSDGDIVLYCDVGRKYPYLFLDAPLDCFTIWMDRHQQDIMPGVYIPWGGSMEVWTKQDAFIATGIDGADVRNAPPIQASFSLWRNTAMTRAFVAEWLGWCVQRQLVSDDPSLNKETQSPKFKAHRHDQSLFNLCCHKHGIKGIHIGPDEPHYNERDPSQILRHVFGANARTTVRGRAVALAAASVQAIEKTLRQRFTLGKKYE
jgi:hypothetical protein